MNGVVLVTGGGRGIGRAVATALARAGMAVGVTARTGAELAETVADIEAVGDSCSKTALARFSDSLAEETREHGVSVFALGPGTVRTAMATGVLDSAEGRRWLGGIDEVAFVPTDTACRAVLFLASGEGDALSGRFVFATDDLGELARNADDITARQLYQLRLARR